MTEYEMQELLTTTLNGGTAVLSLLVTAISGYLIVAWLVGARLTQAQVLWVNLLFAGFSVLLILRWSASYFSARALIERMKEAGIDTVFLITTELVVTSVLILSIAVLGSLKFMWDIRHPKEE